MQSVLLKSVGGVVQFLLPRKADGLAMSAAEARGMAFLLWSRAREAELQLRTIDPEEAGPWVVISQRREGEPLVRAPSIFHSRLQADSLRDRLLFALHYASAEVVPLARVEETCEGR